MMISTIINNVDNPIGQLVFAHGAGADKAHEFMEEMTGLMNQSGFNVIRFNFPFMDKRAETAKQYPPDRMPKLLDCFEEVIKLMHSQGEFRDDLPLLIGGKSMGSRVAAMLLAKGSQLDDNFVAKIQGVFCLGYPFHPDKKPEKLRLAPLQQALKPVLILQGDRDALGSQVEVDSYQLSPLCQCHFFLDGDHSLKPRVKSGYTRSQHLQQAVSLLKAFALTLSD